MSNPIRIGLVGLGTVGQGVIRVLRTNADQIERRLGRALTVTHAAARDLGRKREESLDGIELVSDPMKLAGEAEIDLLVEAIGGQEPAKSIMLAALERGVPAVTANKALLAEDGETLFSASARTGVPIAYESSVAGGIPIIKTVREGLAGNRIDRLAGIMNGTCNYILTQMATKGQSFSDALAEAQKLGYAEADPTFDVEGIDAAHKLTLLASNAFGIPLAFKSVYCEGISKVSAEDVQSARALGYCIKLLGIAESDEAGVSLRVHPTLVPDDQLLAKVDGVLNAVVVEGNSVGPVGMYGAGAGGDATASAIVADLVDLARTLGSEARRQVPSLAFQPSRLVEKPLLAISQVVSSYYLRMRVADEPGVLKSISSVLAEAEISIEAILQKEPRAEKDATITLITSEIIEHRFDQVLATLTAQAFVRGDISRLRVQHLAG